MAIELKVSAANQNNRQERTLGIPKEKPTLRRANSVDSGISLKKSIEDPDKDPNEVGEMDRVNAIFKNLVLTTRRHSYSSHGMNQSTPDIEIRLVGIDNSSSSSSSKASDRSSDNPSAVNTPSSYAVTSPKDIGNSLSVKISDNNPACLASPIFGNKNRKVQKVNKEAPNNNQQAVNVAASPILGNRQKSKRADLISNEVSEGE